MEKSFYFNSTKFLGFFFFLLIISGLGKGYAQEMDLRISGTVTSAEDGMPIPGVNVFVQGTTFGTTTYPATAA